MYHLIACTTVLPTLKSARSFCDQPRPPQFILSSERAQDVFEKAHVISGGRHLLNDIDACVNNGVPVFMTPDWTYYVVKQG